MEFIEFKEQMCLYGKDVDLLFTDEQLEKFYKYMNLLIEWNEKINLTAIIEPKEIILKHFIDSLMINSYIDEGASLVDVGTGAGFPGIPIKIFRDDVRVCLVDSLNKRINFLNEVILELGLENIETVHSRVEDFGKSKLYRESFDFATARAVANMAVLSEYLVPTVKVGGACICMKGGDVKPEVLDAEVAIETFGACVGSVDSFVLPGSEFSRSVVVLDKITRTPGRFPRKAGVPAKEPIK